MSEVSLYKQSQCQHLVTGEKQELSSMSKEPYSIMSFNQNIWLKKDKNSENWYFSTIRVFYKEEFIRQKKEKKIDPREHFLMLNKIYLGRGVLMRNTPKM